MVEQIDAALNDVSRQAVEDDERVTEYMKKMLSVMEYGVPYTSKAIMDKLGLKSKETFRKNYLNPAMEMHMVEMTIPDNREAEIRDMLEYREKTERKKNPSKIDLSHPTLRYRPVTENGGENLQPS